MSKTTKIEKLRARRASLESTHAGLQTQLDAAERGVSATAQLEAKCIKKQKLAVNDEMADIDRRIAALQAAARRPKLVHEGTPATHVALRQTLGEPDRIAV